MESEIGHEFTPEQQKLVQEIIDSIVDYFVSIDQMKTKMRVIVQGHSLSFVQNRLAEGIISNSRLPEGLHLTKEAIMQGFFVGAHSQHIGESSK